MRTLVRFCTVRMRRAGPPSTSAFSICVVPWPGTGTTVSGGTETTTIRRRLPRVSLVAGAAEGAAVAGAAVLLVSDITTSPLDFTLSRGALPDRLRTWAGHHDS